jgi:hypothetical protein
MGAMDKAVSMEAADNLYALQSNRPDPERIVIKDADITIVVENPPDVLDLRFNSQVQLWRSKER